MRALSGVTILTRVSRTPEVRSGLFITLKDGTRLAARVWLPDDADTSPVPAVLEYLPYRLNDGTVAGDHQQMTYFAGHGYAGVRVDIRGTGESEGICSDEYTPQEQADCLEVIAWIAAQPWCTGAVGMMGYSWSGFNCLQVAALRPPALRRSRPLASDDRYADDVHYRGGLVIPMDMVHWSTCMLGWQARPPDPRGRRRPLARDVAGAARPAAVDRALARAPAPRRLLGAGLRVATTTRRIACPVMCVAGWTDGYTDAALRLMEGLNVPRRALIGPWGHNDPVHGAPGPAVGDPRRAGALVGPVAEGDRERHRRTSRWSSPGCRSRCAPAANIADRPGRWVGEQEWPTRTSQPRTLLLGDGTLTIGAPRAARAGSTSAASSPSGSTAAPGAPTRSRPTCRSTSAATMPVRSPSLAPLAEPSRSWASPRRGWCFASTGRWPWCRPGCARCGRTAARCSSPAASSTSASASRAPNPSMVPVGEELEVAVAMDSIAHRFHAGSRIRLSVSPCYWPLAWPSPREVTLELLYGTGAALVLPVRAPSNDDEEMRLPDPPEEPAPLQVETVRAGSNGGRSISRDLGAGRTELMFDWGMGGFAAAAQRDALRGHLGGPLLDHRRRSPVGARDRREHVGVRARRLDGRHPGERGDDLDRDSLHRHLQSRCLRRQYAHRRAHVDARVPARPLLILAVRAGLDDPGLVGEHDGLDAVAQSELREHAGDVGLDRRAGHDELLGDLGVGEAAGDQARGSRARAR